MRVDVDAAREDVLPLRVDDAIGVHPQRRADGRDLLAVDEHVAFVNIRRGDDDAVPDEERAHHGILLYSAAFPKGGRRWPFSCPPRLRASVSRTRSCCPQRRRPNPTTTSCA